MFHTDDLQNWRRSELNMSLTVSQLIEGFLAYAKERKKDNTHRFYAGRLVALGKILGPRKVKKLKPADWGDALRQANVWQDGNRKGQPLAPDTIRGNGGTLKQLQQWAIRKKLIKEPLIDNDDIPMPPGRSRQRTPTADEVLQIKSISTREFGVVLDALRRSGARPGEIARATYADWDQVVGVITLQDHKTAGKTGEPRTIVVGSKLKAIILDSLAGRAEGHLFIKPQGQPWDANSLSAAFRRARNELELDQRLVIYRNRSAHATAMHGSHGLFATQLSLGHATGVIGHYVQITIEERQ